MFVLKRSLHNPIIVPYREHHFEAGAVFNMSVVKTGRTYVGVYRAISYPDPLRTPQQISIIGKGESTDGIHFEHRAPFIEPKEEWDRYGCEDPRIVFFEGRYYIFYTALGGYPFGPGNIKTAVAISKDLKTIDERHLLTPFNSKAMVLFPQRIDGKIAFMVTVDPDSQHSKVAIGYVDTIEQLWDEAFWKQWYTEVDMHTLTLKRSNYDHIEIGAEPLKIKEGWLLVYSYMQDYFPNPDNAQVTFGVEAVILDEKNPHTVTARTRGSFLSPDEMYERRGLVAEIVFPTGALIEKDLLHVYYGGADNVICRASVHLHDLITTMQSTLHGNGVFVRAPYNPVLTALPDHPWEDQAVFNPGILAYKGVTYIFYRAMSKDNTSTIGLAISHDNATIAERLPYPIYIPREPFEMKINANANSGCEDPRITLIDGRIYMVYTAYDSVHVPKVAVSSISLEDFLNRNFVWDKPRLITPEGIDDKDACIFPEKINDAYLIFHRVGGEVCADYIASLDFEKEKVDSCIAVVSPRNGMWDSGKVGIAGPPVKTDHGWLLIYHASSKRRHTYRLGALLLDLADPTLVLARSTDPIFEPTEEYEKVGLVNNVVFPCGMVVKGTGKNAKVYLYYGGADSVIGIAECALSDILDPLVRGMKLED